MGFALLALMVQVRNRNLKRKADIFNRLSLGVKVFKGLAMNSLSQACLQLSESTPSNKNVPTQEDNSDEESITDQVLIRE